MTDQGQSDREALSLVGAVIGDFRIDARVRPGKRWRYVARNHRTGETRYLRGYELVRAARMTVRNGGAVVMPNGPWRNEEDE